MKITRYPKGRAKILQPRWQCWRCQGRRVIVINIWEGETIAQPCPNCTSPDTPAQIGTWRRIAA